MCEITINVEVPDGMEDEYLYILHENFENVIIYMVLEGESLVIVGKIIHENPITVFNEIAEFATEGYIGLRSHNAEIDFRRGCHKFRKL